MDTNKASTSSGKKNPEKKKSVGRKKLPKDKGVHKCSQCDKVYSHKRTLLVHEKRHDKYLRIECKRCPKIFCVTRKFQEHMLTHTGETPFKCKTCGHGFAQKSTLGRHKLQHLTSRKRFKCTKCRKAIFFHTAQQLRYHMKVHDCEKTHVCEMCDKKFLKKSDWDRHVMIHSDKKPFGCIQCSKKFARVDNLRMHFTAFHRSAFQSKPFPCEHCPKSYTRKHGLRRHMEKGIHAVEEPNSTDFEESTEEHVEEPSKSQKSSFSGESSDVEDGLESANSEEPSKPQKSYPKRSSKSNKVFYYDELSYDEESLDCDDSSDFEV